MARIHGIEAVSLGLLLDHDGVLEADALKAAFHASTPCFTDSRYFSGTLASIQ
jgi:hypothetical protein